MGICVLLIAALPLWSQQQTVNYSTDINGRRVAEPISFSTSQSGNTTTRSQVTRTVSGRVVPIESIEERVVSEDANGRVVERLVRLYDQDGRPGLPEKQRIEEKKNADGSVSSVKTVYRGDINGNLQLTERVVTDAAKSGDTVNANVSVERLTVNGRLEVVEREAQVNSDQSSQVITMRRDATGQFYEAKKVVTERQSQNGVVVENTAQYEAGDSNRLQLHSQTVSRVRKNPDGSESREVDLFRRVPGRAEPSAAPRLEERQLIEVRKAGDQVIETTLIQRPTVSDPGKLGPPQKLGERVCTGANCP